MSPNKPAGNPEGSSTDALREALAQWKRIVGPEHVREDDVGRDAYARTTIRYSTRPAAVVQPGSLEELQAVVRVAAEKGVRIYPISCGKNWGYGSACAVEDGQVIVELSRMNRIFEVNEVLAYAVLEPGVTQQQLYDYLQAHRLPLWLDMTGAGPDTSILGNALERGYTTHADRFESICGMEVLLADGRVLHSGFGHYPHAKAAHVFKYGLGPYLDGIFTQSSYGVVTKLGLWLMPRPECFNAFFLMAPDENALEAVVDLFRPLRLQGVLQSAVHIANELRPISLRMAYPWERMGGITPLSEAVRAELRRQCGVGAWNVVGTIFGSRRQVAETRKLIRKRARHLGRLEFVSDCKIALGRRIAALLLRLGMGEPLQRLVASASSTYNLLQGVPGTSPMISVHWRKKRPVTGEPRDPLEHRCGLYWVAPIIPNTGRDARQLLDLVTPIFSRHGFDLFITLASITPRALSCVMAISFDKEDPLDTDQAGRCYDALLQTVSSAGYLPYRAGIHAMDKLAGAGDAYWDVVGALKRALDPQGILAYGRYHPRG